MAENPRFVKLYKKGRTFGLKAIIQKSADERANPKILQEILDKIIK